MQNEEKTYTDRCGQKVDLEVDGIYLDKRSIISSDVVRERLQYQR